MSLIGITASALRPVTVTGGTLYTDGSFNYRVFTGNGTLGITGGNLVCDVMVIAGGGAGGTGGIAGGGGAGGFLVSTSQSLTGNISVTIGGGGTGSATEANVTNGSNSTVGSITASVGGGVGGCGNAPFKDSGSGGSSGGVRFESPNSNIGSPTSGQGNTGARGSSSTDSGGGGGAGAAGSAGTGGNQSGAGGAGTSSYSSWGSATGTGQNVSGTYFYAGGGGGGGAGGVGGLSQPLFAAANACFCASGSLPASIMPDKVPVKKVAIGIINSKNFWSIGEIAFSGCVTKIIE